MCNIQSPNTRALIIEVLENGKVSLPPVIHQPEHTLTIDELKKCRDYLDLIISNPDNFHIVSLEPLNIANSITFSLPDVNTFQKFIPKCKSCHTHLAFGVYSQTERDNEFCFKCEKEQILKATDSQPVIVNVKADIAMPAIAQNDDKICDWPGCDKVLNKLIRPNGWTKGHCLSHDGKKGVKTQKLKKEPVVNLHHCSKCSLVLVSQHEIDSMLCIHCNGNFNFDSDPSAI